MPDLPDVENPLRLEGDPAFIREATRYALVRGFDRIDFEDQEKGLIASEYKYHYVQGTSMRSFGIAKVRAIPGGAEVDLTVMDEVLKNPTSNPTWDRYGRDGGVERIVLGKIREIVQRGWITKPEAAPPPAAAPEPPKPPPPGP
jgi:hypothetical protein